MFLSNVVNVGIYLGIIFTLRLRLGREGLGMDPRHESSNYHRGREMIPRSHSFILYRSSNPDENHTPGCAKQGLRCGAVVPASEVLWPVGYSIWEVIFQAFTFVSEIKLCRGLHICLRTCMRTLLDECVKLITARRYLNYCIAA
jgi:hypothetical protein